MSKKTINTSVSYDNFRGLVGGINFNFWENWTPSATYSGYSYSSGQFPPQEGEMAELPKIIATGSVNTQSPKLFSKIATFSTSFELEGEIDPKFPLIITIQAITEQRPYNLRSSDALTISKKVAQLITLRPLQEKAGDTNVSGLANNGDAVQIQNRSLKLIDSFSMGDWVLLPITFSLTDLPESQKDVYELEIGICTTGHVR